ncbi:MAG: nucleotide exchange factor GrpE [Bacteroidales bacterium]
MNQKEKKDTKQEHQTENQNQQEQQGDGQEHHQAENPEATAEESDRDEKAKEPSGEIGDISEYKRKIEALQKTLDETNDKFLRLFSEFDNYRKRVTKERLELSRTAAESIIIALLPVLDDLERASLAAKEKTGKGASEEEEGVVLIYNKFKSILKQKGVEEIPAVGHDFDTDLHEAVSHQPAESKEQKGKVVEEMQKGYILNGKVIRYARVVVAN